MYNFAVQIYGWGQNNCGQVGNGTTSNQPTPRKISSVIGKFPFFLILTSSAELCPSIDLFDMFI